MRCDRNNRDGAGVALYLREDLTGDVISTFDNSVCQLLVVYIHQLDLVVAVIYRPPDTRCAEFAAALKKLDNVFTALPTPTPTICLMGDFKLPKSVMRWVRNDDGHLVHVIDNYRQGETAGGKQDRLQAQRMMNIATKHNLIQQVDKITHGVEILDLVFSNNEDMISHIVTEEWQQFTDHRMITATVTYGHTDKDDETGETHLLEVGKRYSKLDYNQAPWQEIQAELANIDWQPMEELSKDSPTEALNWYHEKVLTVLERLMPVRKKARKKSRSRIPRQRRLLWRRLAKIRRRINTATLILKLTKLLQDKWELETQLREDYIAVNNLEEDRAVFNIKSNPKFFFSFAKKRQKTRSRVGPFIDPKTGRPNPSSDFAAEALHQK